MVTYPVFGERLGSRPTRTRLLKLADQNPARNSLMTRKNHCRVRSNAIAVRPAPFGNKLATTLAMSTQRHYNVNPSSVNRNHLQFMVFQRQPNVFAMPTWKARELGSNPSSPATRTRSTDDGFCLGATISTPVWPSSFASLGTADGTCIERQVTGPSGIRDRYPHG